METTVRKLLVAIQAMNDRYRQNLSIGRPAGQQAPAVQLALARITDERLAIPLNGGYWITRRGRAWLRRN